MKMIKVATAVILGIALCGPALADGSGGNAGNGNASTGAGATGSANTNASGMGSTQSDAPKGTNTDPNPLILAPGAQPQPKNSIDTPAK